MVEFPKSKRGLSPNVKDMRDKTARSAALRQQTKEQSKAKQVKRRSK